MSDKSSEKTTPNPDADHRVGSVAEVSRLFLRLGATAFGGPAVHIGMMHDEVVSRRKWLSDQQFLDFVGATNLIPGPNSTEMAMHIGYLRAGWRGLLAGGLTFLAPAVVMVLALSWAYVKYGSTPQAEWLLYGVKPVVIAIVIQALWKLGRQAIKGVRALIVTLVVVALYFVGVNEIALLALGGLLVMISTNLARLGGSTVSILLIPFGSVISLAPGASPFSLLTLFLHLLKIGAVWYGSGYVLLAFLRADFVERLGWLTDQQLLDAVAIGQITPGPFLTAATFIGYILSGPSGALLATLAICIPSVIFVAVSNPIIPKVRKSKIASSFLDGVNVAALGLMAAVTWQLGRASLVDVLTIVLAAVSVVFLLRFRLHSVWLIAGGAAAGLIRSLVS